MTTLINRTNFKLAVIAAVAVLGLAFAPLTSAAHPWRVQISQPYSETGGVTNDPTFNLEYTVQSVEASDNFTVQAFRGTTLIGTQTIDTANGDSGVFPVNLNGVGDGTYQLKVVAKIDGTTESKTAGPVTVILDRSRPPAPDFDGAVRTSTGYRLNYTVFGADAAEVVIYSSTSSSFTANNSTILARSAVTPGDRSFSYSTSQNRFHAIRVIDSAGNVSPIVGDPGATITVGSTPSLTTASTSSSAATTISATDGQAVVQGDTDTATDDGDVTTTDQDQATDDNAADTDGDGDVEQASDEADDSDNTVLWWTIGILVAAGAWFSYRRWITNQ